MKKMFNIKIILNSLKRDLCKKQRQEILKRLQLLPNSF
jgi:hypothetical protein